MMAAIYPRAVHSPRSLLLVIVAVSSVFFPGRAFASLTLLSNLPSNDGGGGGVSSVEQRAVSFLVLSSPFEVMQVQMRLENYESNLVTAQLSIHLDGSTGGTYQPGTQVGNAFTSPTSSSDAPGTFTFTTTGVHLNPNTKYWVVIKASSPSGQFTWNRSNPTVTPPQTEFAEFQNQWISQDGGSTWSVGSNGAHSFGITGVPEPAETALCFAMATVALIAFRKFRRNPGQS